MRLGCSPTQAHDIYGAGTGSLTAEQAAERAAEMGDEARQAAQVAAQAVADAEQGAEPPARDAGRGAVTQGQGWSVTAGAKRAAEAAYVEWRAAGDITGALTVEQAVAQAADRAAEDSDETYQAAWEAARALAAAEQEERNTRFEPLEYSVLNWPAQLTGAEPEFWGLPGSSMVPRIYADFDEEVMGINLGRMNLRMHYWLSNGKRVFGLSMGRQREYCPNIIYPVHPCRYCIDLAEEDERSARHGTLPGGYVGFMWHVILDGVSFRLEGGYKDLVQDRWMVWADRIEPYTVNHWYNPEATPTVWHPDWPVWGRGLTRLDRRYRPRKAPTHYWIPPVHCLSARGRGEPYCAVESNYPVEGIHCRHIAENIDGYRSSWENGTHAPVGLTFRRDREYQVSVAATWTGPDGPGATPSWPRSVSTTVGIRVRIPANQPQHAWEALEEEQQASGGGGGGGDGAGDLHA